MGIGAEAYCKERMRRIELMLELAYKATESPAEFAEVVQNALDREEETMLLLNFLGVEWHNRKAGDANA